MSVTEKTFNSLYKGRKYGDWTVQEYYGKKKLDIGYTHYFVCICDCGIKELHSIYEIVRSKGCEHEV